ncbi:hypothetical protein R2R35_13845 [Anaerocolumna sp. AGMB13020]|uniref:alpha/beta fold hydrolase n=1 Tax=Anaerocolumna sp. AGMB13020 TaxID=3081750 RepID=UPI00295465C8|nr:hypothetical protein [Anaerocolumna sp. AGMB13020]WOO34883.1 hypothetical protein R2R35_13845 [Anaerocolumna sp. AGMB13020]
MNNNTANQRNNSFIRKTASKNGIEIEYYVFNQPSNKASLIVSMGVWEPASRSFPLISRLKGHHCIVLSYRGRGRSSEPATGFDWADHSQDLACVLEQESFYNPVFLGFSKGVSYMLGFLLHHSVVPKGILIIDYPAVHIKAEEGYSDYWSSLYYNGSKLTEFVSTHTLEGIEKESTYRDFYKDLKHYSCPICILRGMDNASSIPSNLTDTDILKYQSAATRVEIIPFLYSGHMILEEELGKASRCILEFLENT